MPDVPAPVGDPPPTVDRHTVHRYLVTAPNDLRMELWASVGMFSDWLEGRPNGDRETWLTTVFHRDSAPFLTAAATLGLTVEEIMDAGPPETYELRVGEPGTGWWQVGDRLAPDTAGLVAEASRRAERSAAQDVVDGLAVDLGWQDPAHPTNAVHLRGIGDLAAEFAALPDCPHCRGTGKNVPDGWTLQKAAALFPDEVEPKGDGSVDSG